MDNSFNVTDFYQDLNDGSISKPSRYMIRIAKPKGLPVDKYPIDIMRRLSLRSNNATLPGLHFFESNNIRRTGAGASEQRPYSAAFNSFNVSFILDVRMQIHEFFMEWARLQVDFDRKNGEKPYYLLNYKDAYNSQMMIDVYNQRNEIQHTIQVNDVHIETIGDVSLSWNAADQMSELTVTFGYKDFKVINRIN